MALLDDYRKWDEQRAFHSQGRITKLIPHIEACARRMCTARPESVDALRASAFARDEPSRACKARAGRPAQSPAGRGRRLNETRRGGHTRACTT